MHTLINFLSSLSVNVSSYIHTHTQTNIVRQKIGCHPKKYTYNHEIDDENMTNETIFFESENYLYFSLSSYTEVHTHTFTRQFIRQTHNRIRKKYKYFVTFSVFVTLVFVCWSVFYF